MNMAMRMTAAYMESKGVRCSVNEEKNLIRLGFKANNKGSIELMVIFDKDNGSVGLRSFDYCRFPEEKLAAMYEVCSKVNKEYRWIKFFVDERDNTVTLADDAIIQIDSCGEEIFELICRMVSIGDEAYPIFMKALWA